MTDHYDEMRVLPDHSQAEALRQRLHAHMASVSRDDMKAAGLSLREIRELVEKLQAPDRPDFELDLARMRTAEDVAAEMYEAVPGDFS